MRTFLSPAAMDGPLSSLDGGTYWFGIDIILQLSNYPCLNFFKKSMYDVEFHQMFSRYLSRLLFHFLKFMHLKALTNNLILTHLDVFRIYSYCYIHVLKKSHAQLYVFL